MAFAWKLTDELDTIMVPRTGASDPPHNLCRPDWAGSQLGGLRAC